MVVILYSQVGHRIRVNLFLAKLTSHSELPALNQYMNQRFDIFSKEFCIKYKTSSHKLSNLVVNKREKEGKVYILSIIIKKLCIIFSTELNAYK